MRFIVASLVVGAALVAGQVSCLNTLNLEQVRALEKEYLEAQESKENKWLNYNDQVYVYLYHGGGEPNSKMASYGIQNTIVETREGGLFPKDDEDWQLKGDIRFDLAHNTRHIDARREARLVMFHNLMESNLDYKLDDETLDKLKNRTEAIVKAIVIPCTVLISVHQDEFQKPNTGMFDLFQQAFTGDQKVDIDKSYYVGYASGGKRHSDIDRKFAHNLGIEFHESRVPVENN